MASGKFGVDVAEVSIAPCEAKRALIALMRNARGQGYKAVQVAEILYADRTQTAEIDLNNHETYRVASKTWRDEVCRRLVGAVSRSNGMWQDILFAGGTTPKVLTTLGAENRKLRGGVEAFIYSQFGLTWLALRDLTESINCSAGNFSLSDLLARCRGERLLKRLMERLYEVVACALLDTLVKQLRTTVTVQMDQDRLSTLGDSSAVIKALFSGTGSGKTVLTGEVRRIGVANAADGGVDLLANFGRTIQVKHAELRPAAVRDASFEGGEQRHVVICRKVVSRNGESGLLAGIPVITEPQLLHLSEIIAAGRIDPDGARSLCQAIITGLQKEFPGCRPGVYDSFMRERGYDALVSEIATWAALDETDGTDAANRSS